MSTKGEKSIMELGSEFYLLMGNCISTWATVEEYLFKICRASLGCTTKRAAIVYYRTPTIEARRQLADELVMTVLPARDPPSGGHEHDDVKSWSNLNKEIGLLLKTRNRIAHQPMGPRMNYESAIETGKSELWFEIYVSEHESLRKGDAPPGLKKADLEAHSAAVWDAKERLGGFYINTLSKYARLLP